MTESLDQEATVSGQLLKAAKEANAGEVFYLITKHDPKSIDPEIFNWAVTSFSIPIMILLLERYPAMLNWTYDHLGTPLMIACISRGPPVFVKFLLESGADANLVPATVDNTAMQMVVTYYQDLGQCIEIIDLLWRFGARMDGDVLAWAAHLGRVDVMYHLLTLGVTQERDPMWMRRIQPKEQLALHAAAQAGHCSVVLELLLFSVDVNCRNGRNLTAMEIAQHIDRAGNNITLLKYVLAFWRRREVNYGLTSIWARISESTATIDGS